MTQLILPPVPVDSSGRHITRNAATEAGWSYLALAIEAKTSTLNSLFCKDQSRNNFPITASFLKSDGSSCSDQADADSNCTKTKITIALGYDFEIISGNMHQIEKPANNCRLWVYAGAVDLGLAYCKTFVNGLNLKFIGADEQLKTDGRASKLLSLSTAGVPVPTNKIVFEFQHEAGMAHDFMILLEIYRA
jgi:hypothetical protein